MVWIGNLLLRRLITAVLLYKCCRLLSLENECHGNTIRCSIKRLGRKSSCEKPVRRLEKVFNESSQGSPFTILSL